MLSQKVVLKSLNKFNLLKYLSLLKLKGTLITNYHQDQILDNSMDTGGIFPMRIARGGTQDKNHTRK